MIIDKIYRVISNPDIGLTLLKHRKGVYDNNLRKMVYEKDEYDFSLWVDEYEGGEAYQDDWTYEDTFESEEKGLDYIKQKWGEIMEISQ